MAKQLGQLESLLFAHVQMRGLRVVRSGDLTGPLRISTKQERELLSRMARSGIIAQVRRGLYLVPERLPLGGKWSPDESLALNTLMEDCQGRYQVCGPNAFLRYGFDEQVPARVYAYNDRLSGDRKIGAVALTLIKVSNSRLGAVERVKMPDESVMVYSSRTRTLMDAIYDWSRFGSLPRAYEWIRQDIEAKLISPADLIKVAVQYGNQGTSRRIGALLERLGVSDSLLKKLQRILKPSRSLIPWIPDAPKRGTINRRWGIIFNE